MMPAGRILPRILNVDTDFVVAFDLGYWISHWLLHKSSLLWEFHKIHHSAEVLNPFTAFRSHPVEDLLSFNLISLATGTSYGVLVYVFGAAAQEFTLLQMNIVMLVFFLTIFHLRHSHVWLPVRGLLAWGAYLWGFNLGI